MALVKRGRTWHAHFFVDGQRFRQSLATSDWREAQSKEKELIAQATHGSVAASQKGFAKLPFSQAATSYFNGRKLELSESSRKKELQLLVKPRASFQEKCLTKITAEDARYSHVRSEARRQAVTALSAKPESSKLKGSKSEGYDTSHDTKEGALNMPAPEVIENMVGTRRLELLTSTVSR